MYEFDIQDMTCAQCVSTVEKAIKTADPAARSTIDLKSRTARVETEVDPAAIGAAIENAGYATTFRSV